MYSWLGGIGRQSLGGSYAASGPQTYGAAFRRPQGMMHRGLPPSLPRQFPGLGSRPQALGQPPQPPPPSGPPPQSPSALQSPQPGTEAWRANYLQGANDGSSGNALPPGSLYAPGTEPSGAGGAAPQAAIAVQPPGGLNFVQPTEYNKMLGQVNDPSLDYQERANRAYTLGLPYGSVNVPLGAPLDSPERMAILNRIKAANQAKGYIP